MAGKWMQRVSNKTEKAGRKGQLHRDLGIPMGEKIPWNKLVAASKQKGKIGMRARMAMRYMEAKK